VETSIAEIADGIYRLSTFVPEVAPPAGFTFNQFLVLGGGSSTGIGPGRGTGSGICRRITVSSSRERGSPRIPGNAVSPGG